MFCIAHVCIRNAFDKQFHFHKTAYCLSLTLAIIWFAIPSTLPVSLSLLSSIPIAFGICFVGFIVQDRLDAHKETSYLEAKLNSILLELEKYKNIDLFNMSEDDLRQYAASQGLSENQIDILCMKVYQHLKISEICRYANYGRTTVKYHLEQIKRKLNIRTFP
jgi:DNA-binding CsgD family transcriptional regulator